MRKSAIIIFVLAVTSIWLLSINAAENYTYDDDIKSILTQNGCTGCHDYSGFYSSLMSQKSIQSTTRNVPIVYAAKPDSSVIVWRIEGALPDGSALTRMPRGGDKLGDETIQMIRDWISQGAPDKIVAVDDSKQWGEIKSLFKE